MNSGYIYVILLLLFYGVLFVFINIGRIYCPTYKVICSVYDTLSIIINVFIIVYYIFVIFVILKNNCKKKTDDEEQQIEDSNADNTGVCLIHIPYFKEPRELIKQTLDSIVNNTYKRKLIVLTIDGNERTDEVFDILNNEEYNLKFEKRQYNDIKIYEGFYCDVPYCVIYKQQQCGKRQLQKIILKLISWTRGNETTQDILNEVIYRKMSKIGINLQETKYLCFVDADTTINTSSLRNAIRYLKDNDNCIGVCGETTIAKSSNIWCCIQRIEYWLTHKFIKMIENEIGNVLVLSGCFCVYKIETEKEELIIDDKLIDEYTKVPNEGSVHDKNLLNIGEDRYLSTLLILKNIGKLKYIQNAKCETKTPPDFYSLLLQRRRWTNSMIHCLIQLIKKTKSKKLLLLSLSELTIVMLMPFIYVIGIIYAVENLIIPIFINVFPLILIISFLRTDLIIDYFLFFILQIVFMVIIPIYSFIQQDDTTW